jgi:hypothetical protein
MKILFLFLMVLIIFIPVIGSLETVKAVDKGALIQGYENPPPYFRYDIMSPNGNRYDPKGGW